MYKKPPSGFTGVSVNSETLATSTSTFQISAQHYTEETPVVALGNSTVLVVWSSSIYGENLLLLRCHHLEAKSHSH